MPYLTASTLVFIDSTIQDYQYLIDGIIADAEVIILNLNQDGIEQITQGISQHTRVDSVHIVSHGKSGKLYLGSTQLSLETLNQYGSQLQSWSTVLTPDADILLYGCEVAAEPSGHEFVQQLSRCTGAAVAASTNLTGSAALGGDWELEVQVGQVKSPVVFEQASLDRYPYTLAPDAIPNLIYAITGDKVYFTSIQTGLSTNPTNPAGNTIPNTLAFTTNANARDPLSSSSLLYYVGASTNRIGTWNLLTGAATDLAAISGAALSSAARMAFRSNGQLYVMNSNNLYTVSTGTGLGVGNTTPAGTATLVATIANLPTGGGGDMAFDPANPDLLYIAGTTSNSLYKVTFTGSTPSAATLLGAMGASSPGLAFGPDGNLYGSNGNNIVKVNTANGSTTTVGNTGNGISDFAALPTPSPDVDLSITVTDSNTTTTPGSSVTYTITVTNTSGFNVYGVSVKDLFNDPNLTGTANWSAAAAAGVSFPTTADQSGTGNINVKVNLQAGATVTYKVTGLSVSPTATGTISNTATITPPEGITDKASNTGANSATDSTTVLDVIPPVVTVKSLTTKDNTPQLTGTVDDKDATVVVTVNGKSYTATNNGNGTWTLADDAISPALVDDTYDVKVTATDKAGNVGSDATVGELVVDTTAPIVTVTALTTKDNTPQLSGTVNDPDATVTVTVNGASYTATNNKNGTWTLADNTISPALLDNTYDVKVTATDKLGNTGTDATVGELIVDTTAPVVTVTSLTTKDNTPQLTGTVDDPDATVIVEVNGKTYDAVNNGDGTWTLADDSISPTLADNTYDVKVTATDKLGNTGTDATVGELIVDTTAPVVTVTSLTTKDSTPQLLGTIDDKDATVIVEVNGKTYDAVNNGDGTWTLADDSISPTLADNTYDVKVTATDKLGNTGTDETTGELVVDTTAPVVTVTSLTTKDNTPQLTGTIDDKDATVTVEVNGKTYTATNNKNGTWTLADGAISPALLDNTYDVKVTATDKLGNAGTDATVGELIVDTTAPVVTVTALKTKDNTPQLTGTVDDPDATVIVEVNGKTYTAVNNGDGTWTLADDTIDPALLDNTYDVKATATDKLGNAGIDTTTGELVIDTTAPVVTVTALTTKDNTPQLTGTVDDPDAAVTVEVNGKTYTATNNKNGTWTLADDGISPTLADNTYDVKVTATDKLGNAGTDATVGELIVDTTAPVVTITALTTKDNTPQLTGTVDDPDATVTVEVNGKTYTATVVGNTWTLADDTISPALLDNTYDVKVTATDKVGNTGTDETTGELVIDTTAPVATVTALTTKDNTPQLTGTVDDKDATITVEVNGKTYNATVVGNTWTLADDTISPALLDNIYDVKVTATDKLGNTGTDATVGELIVDTTAPVVTVTALITKDNTPQLTGTVDDKDATITVEVNGKTYTTTVVGNTWTLADNAIDPTLADNTYDVKVTATDKVGNTGTDATTDELVIDTTAPVVTVTSLTTEDNTPQLTGTVDDKDAAVTVEVNGKTYTATNNKNGTWTLADGAISPALLDNTYDVKVTATDKLGNAGTDATVGELIVDTTAPVVTVTALKTKDNTPQLTGTVDDPDATVIVEVNGKTYTAVNNGDGTWTLADDTISPALLDSTYDIKATATDKLGNTGTDATTGELVVDTTAPVVTVTSLITKDNTPQLTGTIDDKDASVVVTVNGKDYTADNNGNGTWTLADNTIDPALLDNTYDVKVTATDKLGNTGTDETTGELVIDTTAPVVAVTALKTKDNTPQLTGTVDDPDAAVTVEVTGKTYTATNNGDGTWTLADDAISPALLDNTYDVKVTATDKLGNTGTDATVGELIVDTTAPVVTVTALTTKDNTPQLTGTIDDKDAIVTVEVNGKTYTATNNKNGTWTLVDDAISPALLDNTYDVKATATDKVGNTGTDETTGELVIDTTAPVVAVTALKTKDDTPQLTGTVDDPDATVIVEVNGKTYDAVNNGDGTWTLADDTISPALLDNTYDVKVTVTDKLNNIGTDATVSELVIDTTAPVVTVDFLTTSDNTPRLTGTVDDKDATVKIEINGKTYFAVNNGDSTWVLADNLINPALADSTYDVFATATDSLGNTGSDTTTGELVVDATIPAVTINSLQTKDNTPELSGTVSDPSATVKVTVAGQTYDAVTKSDGTWTLSDNIISPALLEGVYDVKVTAINKLGKTGSDTTTGELSIDTSAPIITVNPLSTSDKMPQLTGTVDDKTAAIKLTVADKTYDAINNGDGTWTLPDDLISPALLDKLYDVQAIATDVVGNAGVDTTTNELLIDSTAPIVTIKPVRTSDSTPLLTGTIDDETASVEVAVSGKSYTAINNGDGTWTLPNDTIVPALKDGTYDVVVTATDTNRNVGKDNTSGELIVDTTLPAVLLTPIDLTTGEDGSSGQFQVVLNQKPTATVVLTFNSSDVTEGTPTKQITFTPDNWNQPQTVVVVGIDDDLVDSNVAYRIQTSVSSSDNRYSNLSVSTVTFTNSDNDTTNAAPVAADVTVDVTSGTTINLTGLTATDSDGAIASYIVSTLPAAEQGTLFLGDPANGGTLATAGQTLLPSQISQLFFQSTTSFTGSSFSYTAIDSAGLADAAPAVVSLNLSASLPPVASDVTITLIPGALTNVAGLVATDPDGTIIAYIISTLPPVDQGVLFLGDPANGGTAVQAGQKLTLDQIKQLVFQSSNTFSSASFTYTAIDNIGAIDRTPATVVLSTVASRLPICQPGVTLKGTRRKDGLQGTSGGDQVRGLKGNDNLHGWDCNDVIIGGRGKDRLFGDDGRDVLRGGVGNDRLSGGNDGDVLNGGRGKDRMSGGRDDDMLKGGQRSDRLNGNQGNDRLMGGLGQDRLRGSSGNDRLRGNRGNDRLWGGDGNDVLGGGLSRDQLTGNKGSDRLFGRRGNDVLRGRQGDDVLYGGLNHDVLRGLQGQDHLEGGAGKDKLSGGMGDDVLIGNGGKDLLVGGSGADRFVFNALKDKADRIVDFDSTEDVIDLSRLFAKSRYSSNNPFADYIELSQSGSDTVLRIDANGAAAGNSRTVLATLVNVDVNILASQNFVTHQ